MKERRVQKRFSVLNVLYDVEQDDHVIPFAKLRPSVEDVVVQNASLARIATSERFDIQVRAVENPLSRSAQLSACDSGAATNIKRRQLLIGPKADSFDKRVGHSSAPLEPEVILRVSFVPLTRKCD